jgi:hypothetical protein
MLVRNYEGAEARAEIRCGVSYDRKSGVQHTVINPGSKVIEFIEIEKIS